MDREGLQKYLEHLWLENRQLETMIASGQRKRLAIIGNQVEELDRLLAEENVALQELRRLEGARGRLETDLAGYWALPDASVLNAAAAAELWAQRLPESSPRFRQVIASIRENMARLMRLNQENQELIALALDYIDDMQRLLVGEENAGLYSGAGLTEADEPRPVLKLLDKKI
jgi:flagellar biosynthesis/type III secretory pathway chaperone